MKNTRLTAIYVRVSSTKESQQYSPEHQEAVCREKARQLHLHIDEQFIYEDRDTGTNIVTRPAIQQMLRDAQEHQFNNVIFASLSRFSRDTLDSISLKRMLVNTLGKRLVAIDEGYDSEVDRDELKFQIIAAVNQKHSEQISFSSRRGKRQSALKGNYTGSVPPFGYNKAIVSSKKTLVPNPDTMSVVQLIFKLYTAHKWGERAIASYLNEQEIPSPRSGLWGISTLQRILQNEAYTGVNVFGKYETAIIYNDITDMTNRSRKLVPRDKALWEKARQPLTHQPIISEEQFQAAQELRLLRGGGTRGGARQIKNVLAGLIFCSHCLAAMVSMTSSRKSKQQVKSYRYLICSKRRRQGAQGCSNHYWLPYDKFKQELLYFLSKQMNTVYSTSQLYEQWLPAAEVDYSKWERRKQRLEKQLSTNRLLLLTLRKDWMNGSIDQKQFNFEKKYLEDEIAEVEQQLLQLPCAELLGEKQVELEHQIQQAFTNLLHLNYDENNQFDQLRFLLHDLVVRIDVNESGAIDVHTTFQHHADTFKPHLECHAET